MRTYSNVKTQYWWWSYMVQLYSEFFNVRNWLGFIDDISV